MKASLATAALALMLAAAALAVVLVPAPAHAATPVELNVRQDIDNASRNRVASARLQAMLADNGIERGAVDSIGGTSANDCTTQIGNTQGGGSLLDPSPEIIIVGDITNVCL